MSGSFCTEIKSSSLETILPLKKKILDPDKLKPQKVILMAGPTACGKTTLSLMLAEAIGGEIVSCDSMQVYRGMNIGTAKVTEEEQEKIPHHLVDIRHIQDPFNVVDFYYEAKKACDSILSRNRIPILVGGSGFYFRTFLYGPPKGPPSVPEVRKKIEEEMKLRGPEPLFEQLKAFDPTYAETITGYDKQKIVRAIEIITLTGEKVSKLESKKEKPLADYQYHAWFLYRPKEVLYKMIEMRCEKMLEAGLVDEVKSLVKQGLLSNSSASQAIGYRQVLDYLATNQSEEAYKKFVAQFKTASRQYAKRQFTWFKKEPLFRWLNVEVHDFEIACDMIIRDFQSTI